MANRKRQRGNGQGTLYRRLPDGPWRGAFYDHEGRRRDRSTGTSDRRAAERVLGKWVSDATLRREGVIDASAETLIRQGRRPISELLIDWRSYLAVKGNTSKHVAHVCGAVDRLVSGMKAATLTDLTPARVQGAIADLKGDGLSLRTCNHAMRAVKSFTRWTVCNGGLRLIRWPG